VTRLIFAAFLLLAAGWGLVCAWRDRREEPPDRFSNTRRDPFGIAIQSPLFFLSVWFAWDSGALSRILFSPSPWLLGILAGHIIFAASLLITHGRLSDTLAVLGSPGAIIHFAVSRADLTLKTFAVAFTEELIFREAAQRAVLIPWVGAAVAIPSVALCFVAVHEHLFRNTARVLFEFVGFALLLGVLYYAVDHLALVTAVHAVRNLESAWLEDDLDDPSGAKGKQPGAEYRPADAAYGPGGTD